MLNQPDLLVSFFKRLHIEIQNNKIINTGGPSQQVIDMCSHRLSKTFLKCYPCIFKKSNGCVLIDTRPLTKHDQEVVLSCIIDMCCVLLQSRSLPPLTDPAFSLGLLHPNCVLGVNFWNGFTPPLECTPEIESFFYIIPAY